MESTDLSHEAKLQRTVAHYTLSELQSSLNCPAFPCRPRWGTRNFPCLLL